MNIVEQNISGLFLIEPKIFGDERGYFFESFRQDKLKELGIDINFIQGNQSSSSYGVIRGLHYQLSPHSQSKLIRVLTGEILDVVVDIRKNSPTFKQVYSVVLSAENKKQLLIPQGFAHGFSVLCDHAEILYKCDNYYKPELERGINYNDPSLNIDWKIDIDKAIISSKDKVQPFIDEAEMNFKF
jgi:dTDP-4-dehydrorhamnose 3,5-epimerase